MTEYIKINKLSLIGRNALLFGNVRTLLVVLHDIVALVVAWLGAYWLRFNLSLPHDYMISALFHLLWVMPLQACLFWYFGLYRGMWRFASLPDLKRILNAVGVAAVVAPVAVIMFRFGGVPRSVLLLNPLLLVLLMGGSRLTYRAWKDYRIQGLLADAKPVLVIGAGSAGDFLLREMSRTSSGYQAVGVLDDNVNKVGRHIRGVSVLGTMDEFEFWVRETGVNDVILAIPSAPHQVRKRIADQCASLELNLLTVPSMDDIMQGRLSMDTLRKIQLEDLLGRDAVTLDSQGLHALLTNQVVLVTGAGGSIGSELCRQVARFQPEQLVLFEQNELALYQMEQEFSEKIPDVSIVCVIGDVKDVARVEQIMMDYQPSVVFHAAAYKHVPMMEEVNASQALKNNVLGTLIAAKAAKAAGVAKFVMISTDKAVNPTNVMGASKRLAEMVCQAIQGSEGTRFVSVRFGNVLGSSGSVIPKFQKQIEAGGPITVTHPEINRFFMSIPEAAQLVLQAGLMGNGGEIFVMDMGDPVKIADLARDMIRLSGFAEDEIKIVYTGLRPGEKLYEELLADDELTLPTHHSKLRIAKARQPDDLWLSALLGWLQQDCIFSDELVKEGLRQWVPEYCNASGTDARTPLSLAQR